MTQEQTQVDEKYLGKMHDGSLGAHRVRENFNPGGDPVVNKIKRQTADLIDLCEQLRNQSNEMNRLVSLAQTHYEDAAMWAVKAATTPK